MKKNCLLFLFVAFTTILSAQNTLQGKVFYTVSFKPYTQQQTDSILEKGKRPTLTRSIIRKMMSKSKDVTGVLAFSKNESLYKIESKLKNEASSSLNMATMIAGSSKIFYTNNTKKEYYKQLNYDEPLRVDLLPIKWKITQETKNIGNYLCFKATAIIKIEDKEPLKITTWFTPTIPVSFGPIHYFGLPGLILEVSYGRVNISATKIVLNPKEKVVIKKPTKGKRMTHKEYTEMNKNFFKNLERKR